MGLIARRFMGVRTCSFPTVTIASLTANLSLVDGTAFITNPSTDLTPYVGCKITLIDTSGYRIQGWIKGKGTGEDISGGDILAGWDFTNAAVWAVYGTGAIIDSNSFSSTSGGAGVYMLGTNLIKNALYKGVFAVSAAPSNGVKLTDGALSATFATNLVSPGYGTSASNNQFCVNNGSGGGTTDVTQMELYKVLTPSATGVTIKQSESSSTENWGFKSNSFLPNSATFTAIIEA